MSWNYKKSIAQRVWISQRFRNENFDKALYNAVLTEMRRIGLYIRCGNMSKTDLKECREFYISIK